MNKPEIDIMPGGKAVALPLAPIAGKTAPAEAPCQLTMGAAILFEEICGHTLDKFNGSTKEACAFVYGCAVGGCARAGLPFDLTFAEFCHAIDPAALNDAVALLQSGGAAGDEPEGETGAEKKS